MAIDPILNHPDVATLRQWWGSTQSAAIAPTESVWWQFRLFGEGVAIGLEELDQSVKIILTTPQGSDIHRPDFSSGIWNYIDYPLTQARPYVVRESTAAIEAWEPRVRLESVEVTPGVQGMASLGVSAAWSVVDDRSSGTTEVRFG